MAICKQRNSIETPKVELCGFQGNLQFTPEFHLDKLSELKIDAVVANFEPPRTPANTPKASLSANQTQLMLSPDLFANLGVKNWQ